MTICAESRFHVLAVQYVIFARKVIERLLQAFHIFQGNQKQAIVPKHLLKKYEDTFEERKIYDVRVFNVFDSNVEYRAIEEDWTIHIRWDTTVTSLDEDYETIPCCKFGFVTDDVLPSRIDKKDQLTVTTCTRSQTIKRELQLETTSGKSFIASLWAEKTVEIDESVLNRNSEPLPIVITSTIIVIFGGKFSFASTHATKLYINIQIPETNEDVRRLMPTGPAAITLMTTSSNSANQSNLQTLEANLTDMMNDIWNANCLDKKYVVEATIMKLSNTTEWSTYHALLIRAR